MLPDGLLQITDPEVDRRLVYARYDPLDAGDDAVFEICCRVLAAGGSYGVAFGFIDTEKDIEVGLFPHQVAMYLAEGAAGAAFDTTDALHTYRIVKTGASVVEVSVDGAVVLSLPYGDLAVRTAEFPESQRQVLATSGAETSEWEIAYACYSIASSNR